MTASRNVGAGGFDDYKEIERRIAAHPGYQAHLECEAIRRSIAYVFGPNWQELLQLLNQAAQDTDLAFELVQNVSEPHVREAFHALLTRRLHNYLASTMSLVDHSRHAMAKRSNRDDLALAHSHAKAELLRNPEIQFMQDLRSFMLHRTLPAFAHSVTIENVNTAEQTVKSEVELNVADLLHWRKWSATSRRYLNDLNKVVVLRPLVARHGELVYWFNRRLYSSLVDDNRTALSEVDELVIHRNAAWAGVDFKTAARITDEWPASSR